MADQLNRPSVGTESSLTRRPAPKRQSIQKAAYEPVLATLSGSFAVIDIETTGLDPSRTGIEKLLSWMNQAALLLLKDLENAESAMLRADMRGVAGACFEFEQIGRL